MSHSTSHHEDRASALEELLGEGESWTPADLARLLQLHPDTVTHHCRHIFRSHRGRYRFGRVEALRVLKYVNRVRNKRPAVRKSIGA